MRVLRFVGRRGCSAQSYSEALGDKDAAVVDTLPGGANVTLMFRRDGKAVHIPLTAERRDLLDLAVSVYIADELEDRAASPDGWTRSFDVLYPVKDPNAWAGAESHLQRALSILSGDEWTFEWPARTALPKRPEHRVRLPRGFDVVCLFSGGIDSLLGAYGLLKQGRKVILVGHQADGITASTQKDLAAELRRMFPDSVSLIQCRVAHSLAATPRFSLPEKKEITHRVRSFLFLGLAVVVAAAARINEIFLAENGLIALNPPLQTSRMGSLTTRTAHPLFLTRFLDFVAKAGLYGGTLRNPFLYESKTDMLRKLPADLHPLALHSISCARTWTRTTKRHCGYCVPCLYRRVAMMEASLDRTKDYAFDVFRDVGTGKLSAHRQADFRALVQFAKRVSEASEDELEMLVFSHGVFSPAVGARIGPGSATDLSPWTAMLKRWAEDFVAKAMSLATRETAHIVGLPTRKGTKAGAV